MRRLGLAACVAAVCLAGCATRGSTHPPGSASAVSDGCVPRNAVTLASGAQECGAFGHSYSGDQLRATGAQHVGAALTQTDPGLSH